jgi:hypothetical protein
MNTTIIETQGIEEFKTVFEGYNLTTYEYVYISLGSKYNEKTIEYKTANKQIQKISNAKWQMIPGFILYKKSLSICIDRFENKEIKKENIKQLIDHKEQNIDILICDIDGTVQLFELLIDFITQRLLNSLIQPKNVIIVNYLRFISPNHTEHYLEENLSKALYSLLVKKTKYSECFYLWFGYQPNLYNIIYKYNQQIIFHILPLLYRILKDNEVSVSNIHEIFSDPNIYSCKSNSKMMIELFLKNTYDITNIDTTIKCLNEYL